MIIFLIVHEASLALAAPHAFELEQQASLHCKVLNKLREKAGKEPSLKTFPLTVIKGVMKP